MAKAGQTDKLDVHKQLSDVTDQWDALESKWSRRKTELENVHQQAVQYQHDLRSIEKWLTDAERNINSKSPVSSDVGIVKKQLSENRVSFSCSFCSPHK